MITQDQIRQAAEKVKSGADFPRFIQDLKALGITHYDTYVDNGSTCYYGAGDDRLETPGKYPAVDVQPVGAVGQLQAALASHQQGHTDYPTFCRQAAVAGVASWTTRLVEMTVSYCDKQGAVLLVEDIPSV